VIFKTAKIAKKAFTANHKLSFSRFWHFWQKRDFGILWLGDLGKNRQIAKNTQKNVVFRFGPGVLRHMLNLPL
jgi:hypothetical protein